MIRANEPGRRAQRDYDAWKRVKVERGMAQAQDRSAMILAEQVLRDLS